jgi:hypothetical protein
MLYLISKSIILFHFSYDHDKYFFRSNFHTVTQSVIRANSILVFLNLKFSLFKTVQFSI